VRNIPNNATLLINALGNISITILAATGRGFNCADLEKEQRQKKNPL
jgi:hypothetical protein